MRAPLTTPKEPKRRLSPSSPAFLVAASVPVTPQRPDSPSSPAFLVGDHARRDAERSVRGSPSDDAVAVEPAAPETDDDDDDDDSSAPVGRGVSPDRDARAALARHRAASPPWRAPVVSPKPPADAAPRAPPPSSAAKLKSNLVVWLEARGLGEYSDAIVELGARKISDLSLLGNDDLDDMGMKIEDRANIRIHVG